MASPEIKTLGDLRKFVAETDLPDYTPILMDDGYDTSFGIQLTSGRVAGEDREWRENVKKVIGLDEPSVNLPEHYIDARTIC